MKIEVLLLSCLIALPMVLGKARESRDSLSEDGQALSRRYAESTIASDISKIVDSMVQKNFVNFLLTQREKKSEPTMKPEEPGTQLFNELLKQEFTQWVHSKGNNARTH
ncbi:gastric inhibitory polypeptide [Conger conger]|uniref:gastric inhibitory polypeptide n=1 Tax=Conger conger TaxID=82655 RepID=UPI002A5AE6AA|nr:gastric inhibitory polypeptide [Conger conger]